MDQLERYVFTPAENALATVGIDSAGKAGVVFALGTAGFLWLAKPSSMFDQSGKPRGWSMFHGATNPTPVPWWLASAGTGWAVSLVI